MDRMQVSSKKVCKSARDSDKKRKKRKSTTRSSSVERSQKRKKICDSKIRVKDLDRKSVKRSRKHSSSSGSDTSSSSSSSTSSSSSSMSSSSSSSSPKNRKKKSKDKNHKKKRSKLKKREKKMKAKRKEKLRAVLTNTEKLLTQHPPAPPPPPKIQIQKPVQTVDEGLIGPDPKLLRAKSMAPMTKQEWEAKQSIIRRVYDEQTGRDRIIKGDGEVLEEIVSLQRHKDINKKATETDGAYFLYSNRNLK